MKTFPLIREIRQGSSLSPVVLNIVLEVFVKAIRLEKEIKVMQVGKKVELSLFADDDAMYRKC